MRRGYLISFEGLDGSGKTTQLDLLTYWLSRHSFDHIVTREPGGTTLGMAIRHLLLDREDIAITPLAEMLLFQADRAQHFEKVILPTLEDGTHVITDRCFDSTIAYQGARGINAALVIEPISRIAMCGQSPDLTLLLDIDAALVRDRSRKGDRLDNAGELFYRKVRSNYLAQASKSPGRIKVIDAAQSIDMVHHAVVKHVEALLKVERED